MAHDLVIVSTRNRFGNERVILRVMPIPKGVSEATVFVDACIEMRKQLDTAMVAIFDMALLDKNQQRLGIFRTKAMRAFPSKAPSLRISSDCAKTSNP